MIKTKQTKCFNYTLETLEVEVRGKQVYSLILYNDNCKKEWLRAVKRYNFWTEEEREKCKERLMANITSHEKAKEDRRLERKKMTNHAKIGDVLVNSWGYDQTNVDFYQVTRLTKKGVYTREIGKEFVDGESVNSMAGYVKPRVDAFLKDKSERFSVCRSLDDNYSISVGKYDFYTASKTDPNEKHYISWYA